jgi:hypothetical protein
MGFQKNPTGTGHENAVRAGFVSSPEHWLYSSAYDYCGPGVGLLDLMILE